MEVDTVATVARPKGLFSPPLLVVLHNSEGGWVVEVDVWDGRHGLDQSLVVERLEGVRIGSRKVVDGFDLADGQVARKGDGVVDMVQVAAAALVEEGVSRGVSAIVVEEVGQDHSTVDASDRAAQRRPSYLIAEVSIAEGESHERQLSVAASYRFSASTESV